MLNDNLPSLLRCILILRMPHLPFIVSLKEAFIFQQQLYSLINQTNPSCRTTSIPKYLTTYPRRVLYVNTVHRLEQSKSEGFDSCDRPSYINHIGVNSSIFSPYDLEIWWMTPKNNRASLSYYIKLFASFRSHQLFQTEVAVRKYSIRVKSSDFFVPCDLEI